MGSRLRGKDSAVVGDYERWTSKGVLNRPVHTPRPQAIGP